MTSHLNRTSSANGDDGQPYALVPTGPAQATGVPIAAEASAGPPPKGRGIKPIVSLLQHKFLALGVFGIMTGLAVPGALVMGKHLYYTEAAFLVSPRFMKNLNADQELELQSNSQYREYVQQQVKTVNRYDVVSDALKRLGEKRWLWQQRDEPDRSAVERLAGTLQVRPVPDTYLVTIGLESVKKDGLSDLINAVLDVYVEKAKAEEFYDSGDRITKLKEERIKALQDVEQESKRRTAIAQELGVTTFSEAMLNPYDQLLIKTRDAFDSAKRHRIDVEASLASLEAKGPDNRSAVEAFAQEMVDRDAGLSGLKSNLNLRRAALLQKLSGLTADHPGRNAIEKELADISEEVTKSSDVLLNRFRSMLLTQKRSLVDQARQIENNLSAEVAVQGAHAEQYAALYNEALGIAVDLERSRKRVNTINDRIDYLFLETNAPGFVRIVTRAREPLSPSKSGHKRWFGMLFLMGVVLALVAPMAADLIDPRVHVPGELQKVTGFPPLASIFDKNEKGAEGLIHDQLVRLATRIERDCRVNDTRVIVMTSSKAAEGTTTMALDLANTLDELGVRTLVVEANRFKPDPRYGDETDRKGLTELLDGRASIDEVVVPGNGELPDRIGVGDIEGRAHLGGIDALALVFQQINRLYSVVLIDTAPLLLSAETEMMVGLADATLLVVQAAGISKAEIKRASQTLERLAPPVVGAILTRMKIFKGGGYAAAVLKEHALARRLGSTKLTSPWLWK
jgi:succinoglycan biosynthesis transport protein ExoP